MTKSKIAYLRHDEVTEKAVFEKMQETGLDQSKAIRMIIREWAEMRKGYVTVPVKGYIDDLGRVVYTDTPKGEDK